MNQMQYTLGIDIGSTTVKIAILDENHQILFSDYKRHFANIQETLSDLLKDAYTKLGQYHPALLIITGSGGLTLAKLSGGSFCAGSYRCIDVPAGAGTHKQTLPSNLAERTPRSFISKMGMLSSV